VVLVVEQLVLSVDRLVSHLAVAQEPQRLVVPLEPVEQTQEQQEPH
jgi:hypothetical protein